MEYGIWDLNKCEIPNSQELLSDFCYYYFFLIFFFIQADKDNAAGQISVKA